MGTKIIMETTIETEFLQVTNPIMEWTQKSSRSTEMYKILTDGEKWSCTCPGYFYKGYCKHITLIKQQQESK